ncbi:MAG TPA: bifunctional DNA-formamidopyrimidine glycosylase/DNA-(apurinic or apyrimidinic site) lyase [Candidatus Binataceae bacterium]|nr:bifunctional DNA-formamidopyrimidine glycosylase/DNA-(apurinic or apyrimidinic site) lyase [Candidatus Binataceae bacterium]
MPELPEVESLRRMLAESLTGRTMHTATVKEPRLRRAVTPEFASAIAGRAIERIERRAKYLLIELAGGHVMLVHLGMSGSLTHRRDGFDRGELDPRHDHVEFALDDGSLLVYNDPRRFGLMKLVASAELANVAELRELGPEPLGPAFNAAHLWQATRKRSAAIKNLLMDQRVVAGVGNIYASEILFRARVRPTRRAGKLTRAEVERIAAETRLVLREAIGGRGTTFRSYRDSRGQPGRFAARLRVYDREGQACLECASPIRAVTVGQRSSFYCPRCQK